MKPFRTNKPASTVQYTKIKFPKTKFHTPTRAEKAVVRNTCHTEPLDSTSSACALDLAGMAARFQPVFNDRQTFASFWPRHDVVAHSTTTTTVYANTFLCCTLRVSRRAAPYIPGDWT